MDKSKARVKPLLNLDSGHSLGHFRLDRQAGRHVGIDGIQTIRWVLDAVEQLRRLCKEEHIAIQKQHSIGFQVATKVEYLRSEQVRLSKTQASWITLKLT